jgi:teichuronic acid exporter
MTMREQVMSALRWTIGARLTAQVIAWAITLVVIRILSPTDYGLLAMASVFIGFLTMFSEFGLGSAVVQRTEIDIATLRRTFGVIVAVHFLLAGLAFGAAPIIADFFAEPRVAPIVRVLSAQFVFAAFAVIPDAMLQRRMEYRRRSLLDLAGAIVSSMTTLALAFAGHGVWALVAGSVLRQAWKTIGINLLSPFRHWPEFSLTGLRSLLTYGGHLTGAQFLGFFFTQIDVVIAGKWLGKELVGFYSVAVHLSSLPNQRIAAIINQVAFPAFARIQNDIAAVGRNFLLGVRVLSFVAFPILWGISSVASEMVEVILGSRWGPVVLPLQVIGLVMPLRMITTFVPNVLQGVGRSDVIFRNYLWASLVTPVAFLVGVQWGLRGLCFAWLVWVPVVFGQIMIRTLPILGLSLRKLGLSIAPAGVACTVMYASVSLARLAFTAPTNGGLRLAILVFVGAAAYAAASIAFNRKGIREVRDLIRGLVSTRGKQA